MGKINRIFIAVYLLCLHQIAIAITSNYKFEHISIAQGLSQSTIYCELQDRNGFLWFGTLEGLNKYDGYSFTVYRNNPDDSTSIIDNLVNSLYEDNYGRIWVGTSNGLSVYNPYIDKFINYYFPAKYKKATGNNQIHVIYQDKTNNIWIGTDIGLFKVNIINGKTFHYIADNATSYSISNNSIWSLTEDHKGNLLVGTGEGLDLLEWKTDKFIHIPLNVFKTANQRNKTIRSLFCDSEGNIWVGSEGGGLFVKKSNDNKFTQYYYDCKNENSISSNEISAIYEDHYKNIWIGTFNGLNKFNKEKGDFTSFLQNPNDPNSISNNIIVSIIEDKSGILWIGTFGGGINKLNLEKEKFSLFQCKPNTSNTLISNVILSINEDKDSVIWIGSDKGLVAYYSKTDKYEWFQHQEKNINSLSDNIVYAIHQDKSGVLWLATKEGVLNKFDIKNKSFKHFVFSKDYYKSQLHFAIRTIYEDKQGLLWLGTGNGIYTFNKLNSKFTNIAIHSDDTTKYTATNIFAIYEDSDDNLWFGTEGNGLCCYNRETNYCNFYKNTPKDTNSISNNNVRAIYEDNNKNLWIGTSGGLNKFNKQTKTFTTYTTLNGLPNDLIYSIVGVENGLWLSTNKGLSYFDFKLNKFRNYYANDGLQSNEFNQNAYFKSSSGFIYFGGVNGLNFFDPNNVKDNNYIPPVYISDFLYYNRAENSDNNTLISKSILYDDEIKLSYKENVFSFIFSSLHYLAPEKNEYSYKMEGFDKDWVLCGNKRYVTYTNLSPGEYTFKIKGSNSDGIWNNEGDSIKIIITPPFWKTKWFYALVFLIVGLIIYTYTRIRIKMLLRDKRKLEYKVLLRTTEIEAQKKEIVNKNEELLQQKEEIVSQKELLEDTNKELSSINIYLSKLSNQSQNTEIAIVISNDKGDIQWVNENFIKLYEINEMDYIAKNNNIFERCINEETKQEMIQSIENKASLVFETINKKSSGEGVWVQTTLLPIEDKDGKLVRIVLIENEISSFVKNAHL